MGKFGDFLKTVPPVVEKFIYQCFNAVPLPGSNTPGDVSGPAFEPLLLAVKTVPGVLLAATILVKSVLRAEVRGFPLPTS